MLSLQELHERFSSYLHNVKKKNYVITNNNYSTSLTLDNKRFNQENDFQIKVASLLQLSESYRHVAIFFSELGKEELHIIPQLLNTYIDKDEFKHTIFVGTIRYEDNRKIKTSQIVFTGKVFIETNKLLITKEDAYKILKSFNIKYKNIPISFSIRDNEYWKKMEKSDWTSVFLCHDSRDKNFVNDLYSALSKKSINAWYDKYEMKLGDSLTEKISKGLNQAPFGIIVISKNFLSNEKWVKFELQSLISKQIHTQKKTILPIWLDINEHDLADYHWLRDKVAAKASEGIDEIVRKIIVAIS